MNTFKLTLLAVSCAAFLSACSSSSGGTDNSEQIRQTETTLTKKLIELTQQVQTAQSQVQRAQARYDEAQKRSESSEAEVIKLNQEVANLRQAQAQLALAQAEQSKASDQDIQKLKDDLAKANTDAEAANKAAKELDDKVAQAQKAREETEKRLKELENLQADEKARIPLSDRAFGGITGSMSSGISGALISGTQEKLNIDSARALNLDEIVLIDEQGKEKPISIAKASYGYIGSSYNSSSYTSLWNSNKFDSVVFGVYNVDDYDKTAEKYLYVQGKPTLEAQMPKVGKVEYKGGVGYVKDNDTPRITSMAATADFANKVIDIKIDKSAIVPEMNFGGKITGNSFAGETNGIKTQGGFFGENAKELSGVFTNDADKSRGVFGAIKQEAAAQ